MRASPRVWVLVSCSIFSVPVMLAQVGAPAVQVPPTELPVLELQEHFTLLFAVPALVEGK
jgi:hypothetical protein